MKLFTAAQIQAWDKFTIQNEPIPSPDLMERAVKCLLESLHSDFDLSIHNYIILCGPGNNGGDGFVLARLLHKKGCTVTVVHDVNGAKSSDAQLKLSLLSESIIVKNLDEDLSPFINEQTIIVDALFGSGLNKPLGGVYQQLVEKVQTTQVTKISIDTPSGLFANQSNTKDDTIFIADYTYSFQVPKLSFLLPKQGEFVGELRIVDIGLSADYLEQPPSPYQLLTSANLRKIVPARNKFSHKGSFGHVALAAGSYGKMGAAQLCTKAALRSGAGLVTSLCPEIGYDIMQIACPEAMTLCAGTEKIDNFTALHDFNVVGIGPGIGTHKTTKKTLIDFLTTYTGQLVLDADALNIIASEGESIWQQIKSTAVITPHPKEFERLFGKFTDDYKCNEIASQKAQEHNLVIILKGAYTRIFVPEGFIYFNNTGNPGMATGGSGDVLTGIITGLLGQGLKPTNAAKLACYWHGLAGDVAAEEKGMISMTAGDIVDQMAIINTI